MDNVKMTEPEGGAGTSQDGVWSKVSDISLADFSPASARPKDGPGVYGWLLVFVVGLALGTVFVNYGIDTTSLAGQQWMLSNVDKFTALSADTGFIIHILIKRAGFFIFLAGMTLLIRRSLLLYFSTVYYGFCFGVVISVMTVLYGMTGLWQLLGLLMPQYLLYIPAYVLLIKLSQERTWHMGKRRKSDILAFLMPAALLLAMMIAGCVLECYVNPIWLTFFKSL